MRELSVRDPKLELTLAANRRKRPRDLNARRADWTHTGKVLALLGAKYDYEQIGKGRLTNDSMIAMSAGRLGITVITANARDFAKLAEFRPFPWRVEGPEAH